MKERGLCTERDAYQNENIRILSRPHVTNGDDLVIDGLMQ